MTAVGDNISVAVSRNENGTLTFSKNVGMTEFNKITYTLADQSFANGTFLPAFLWAAAVATAILCLRQ